VHSRVGHKAGSGVRLHFSDPDLNIREKAGSGTGFGMIDIRIIHFSDPEPDLNFSEKSRIRSRIRYDLWCRMYVKAWQR